jgi:hypothetical protein
MKALFLPDYPDREFYTIVAIFLRLGYFATQDPESTFDFAMCWQDSTWVEDNSSLQLVAQSKPVLNIKCVDISKQRVEQVFSQVFGYSTFINPMTYTGPAVKKYNENASGGYVLDFPLAERDEKFIYQKLIDSSDGEFMVEYRVPVILDAIPVVYVELKDIPGDRIKTNKQSIELAEPETIFSAQEQFMILEFCRDIGLDFGELDIIRSNDDGRIYILDANKTPGGFGMFNKAMWTSKNRHRAIERLADAFATGIQARIAQ